MGSIIKALIFLLVIAFLGCGKQEKNASTGNDSGNLETSSESGAELSSDFVEMQKEIASASEDLLSEISSDDPRQVALKGDAKHRAVRTQRNSDLAGFHAESTKLLNQALDLASDWSQDTDSPPVEKLQDLTRRSQVLTIIAMQQAQIGDAETTQKVLATIKRFNASKIAGVSPGLDESDAFIALAISYAVAGNPEAAEAALERMNHEGTFVVGQQDVLKARAFADICLALARLRRIEDAMFYLDRLGRNATKTDNPIVLGELGKAQLLLGKSKDCEETISDILAYSTAPGQRNQTQEALASLAICLAKAGDSVGAKEILAKCNPAGLSADTARSELVAFHARTLNFRDALVLAGEIQNDFLRARALFRVLDRQLMCGPVFAESAIRLTNLADEQLKAFRDTPTLFQQIQTDHAVAFAKWDLIDGGSATQLARNDPFGNLKKMGNAAKSLSAALAVEEAIDADLPPEHKARIHLSKAIANYLKGEESSSDQFRDAAILACRVEDPSTQVDLLREVCREASQRRANDEIMAWLEKNSKGNIGGGQNKLANNSPSDAELRDSDLAAALIGIAEGIRVEETIRRAASLGIVIAGSDNEKREKGNGENALWSHFVASFPKGLIAETTSHSLLLDGALQMLAVPTQDGVNIAFPPTLEGLRAWVTIVAKANLIAPQHRVWFEIIDNPVGKSLSHPTQVKKHFAIQPEGWLVFSIGTSSDCTDSKLPHDHRRDLLKRVLEEARSIVLATGDEGLASDLAVLYARATLYEEGLKIANSLDSGFYQDSAFAEISAVMARNGKHSESTAVLNKVTDKDYKSYGLRDIAYSQIETGRIAEAAESSKGISIAPIRITVMCRLAQAQSSNGMPRECQATLVKCLDLARGIKDDERCDSLAEIALALAKTGETAMCRDTLEEVNGCLEREVDTEARERTSRTIASALWRIGDHKKAIQLVEEMESDEQRMNGFLNLARATTTAEQIKALVARIVSSGEKVSGELELAYVAGIVEEATRCKELESAWRLTELMEGLSEYRVEALCHIAGSANLDGRNADYEVAIRRAISEAFEFKKFDGQQRIGQWWVESAVSVATIVETLAEAGDTDSARAILRRAAREVGASRPLGAALGKFGMVQEGASIETQGFDRAKLYLGIIDGLLAPMPSKKTTKQVERVVDGDGKLLGG